MIQRLSTHETVDGDHGRIETRNCTVIHDVGWLQARHQRPGLKGVVLVESRREINGKVTDETRFYITSLVLLATAIGPMIRAHWATRTHCTGSWTWSFAITNSASEPTTPQPTSQPAATSPTISPESCRGRIQSASGAKTADWDDEYLARIIAA